MVPYDETGKYSKVKCPKCSSKKKIKLLSQINFSFKDPIGTGRWNNESTGHDYRFKHNLPNVINERMKAEQASHMGKDVYAPINDLDKDSSWG